MTTDTDALTGRIAEAAYRARSLPAEVGMKRDYETSWAWTERMGRAQAEQIAAAVLPIMAAEVHKAKAEGWDEGEEAGYRNAEVKRPYDEMWTSEVPILIDNPYRRQEAAMSADEYEAISEAEWKVLATTEIPHLTDEEKDYLPSAWDEWIARVRRDAAREALDGVADQLNNWAEADAEESVRVYRDTHYPEETP